MQTLKALSVIPTNLANLPVALLILILVMATNFVRADNSEDEETYLDEFQYLLDLEDEETKPWEVRIDFENTYDDGSAWSGLASFDYYGLFESSDYFILSYQADAVQEFFAVDGHYEFGLGEAKSFRFELMVGYSFDDQDNLFGRLVTSEEEVLSAGLNNVFVVSESNENLSSLYFGVDANQSEIEGAVAVTTGKVDFTIALGKAGFRHQVYRVELLEQTEKSVSSWLDISLSKQLGSEEQLPILVSLGRGYEEGFQIFGWQYAGEWSIENKEPAAGEHTATSWTFEFYGQTSFDDPIPQSFQSGMLGSAGVRGYQPGFFQADAYWVINLERSIKFNRLTLSAFTDYGWFDIAPHPIQYITPIESTPLLPEIIQQLPMEDRPSLFLLDSVNNVVTTISVDDDGQAWGAGIGFEYDLGKGFALDGHVAVALKELILTYPIELRLGLGGAVEGSNRILQGAETITVSEQGDIGAAVNFSFSF